MKSDILTKWETVKNQPIAQTLSLPKIRTDLHELDAINNVNEAIKEIKEKYNKAFILTEINQISYVTALIITEQVGETSEGNKPKKESALMESTNGEQHQKKRSDLSFLVEMEKDSRIKEGKRKQMLKRYNIKNQADLVTAKEVLKQQIQAKA